MLGQDSTRALSLTALVSGALCIAFAPILARLSMDDHGVSSTAAAFWRVSLALVPLGLLQAVAWRACKTGAPQPPTTVVGRRQRAARLLLPGLLFGFDLATWHFSFVYTTAANATLFANVSVVLVGLAGCG